MGRVHKLPSLAVAVLLCAALPSFPALAADPVNLEGTWKIAVPQGAFKPEGGSIPFTAEGRKRYQQNTKLLAARNFDDFDYYTARCSSPGLPRLMLTPERFRIWQRSGLIGVQFEWNRTYRQIDMGGLIPQARVGAGGGPFGGGDDDALVGRAIPISKGHWEGETLVVATDGFAGNTLIDNAVPHGYDMKTTERIRLVSADTLEDRITIEDPEYFTKPWETVVTYKRQPDEAFPERVCLDSLPANR
jgi:hypothetical protein